MILRTFALVAGGLFLAGCFGGVLDPGPVGDGNRQVVLNSLAVMLVIVVPTIIGALVFPGRLSARACSAGAQPAAGRRTEGEVTAGRAGIGTAKAVAPLPRRAGASERLRLTSPCAAAAARRASPSSSRRPAGGRR